MIYVDIVNDPYGICRIYNATASCGFAAAMGSGDLLQAQAGCGFLAENVAWGGEDWKREINYGGWGVVDEMLILYWWYMDVTEQDAIIVLESH
jgi:hypothetical protein